MLKVHPDDATLCRCAWHPTPAGRDGGLRAKWRRHRKVATAFGLAYARALAQGAGAAPFVLGARTARRLRAARVAGLQAPRVPPPRAAGRCGWGQARAQHCARAREAGGAQGAERVAELALLARRACKSLAALRLTGAAPPAWTWTRARTITACSTQTTAAPRRRPTSRRSPPAKERAQTTRVRLFFLQTDGLPGTACGVGRPPLRYAARTLCALLSDRSCCLTRPAWQAMAWMWMKTPRPPERQAGLQLQRRWWEQGAARGPPGLGLQW